MKRAYINCIIAGVALILFACKKKESDELGIHMDDICQEWTLTSMRYDHPDTERKYEFIPYYTIKLTLKKGGKYEIEDQWGLLNMFPFNGTGMVSKDVQKKYGSWEFTNESQPDQIVFNKGASTYSLWTESNYYGFYTFSDPEYVFDFTAQNDTLTFISTDYNLMYMYGFYISYDDAYTYCPSCAVADGYDNYNGGYTAGKYFGYAAGYNNGALEAYNDSSQSIKVYRKDPFYNGMADGKLDHLYDQEYLDEDLSSIPLYESGFYDGYSAGYYEAYNVGKNNADRLTTGSGTMVLKFKRTN